ncbi:MAG: DUF192 domain-containing protein [Planctomycetota bacterium]
MNPTPSNRPARLLALLAVACLLIPACGDAPTAPAGSPPPAAPAADAPLDPDAIPATVPITLKGQTFDLELALTRDQQYQGLSDRDFIAPDGGMIFVFGSAARRYFVMRRCLVPIDIAFISPTGTVTAVHAMQIEPYDRAEVLLKRYSSRYPAQFVIELAGGTIETIGLEAGERVELPFDTLKAWREKADSP